MAITGERADIGIRRHFTTPDVHQSTQSSGSAVILGFRITELARSRSNSWASRFRSRGA